MTLVFNGTSYTFTEFNNTLYSENQYGQKGRRLDIRTNINGKTIVFSVSNWDWQNPPAEGVIEKKYSTISFSAPGSQCMEIDGYDFCDAGLVTYYPTGNLSQPYISMEEDYPGFVQITDCNTQTKKVSGTIDAKLVDFFEVNTDTFTVTGTFTDLCYRVLN
jgi:hypothetical protein